MKRCSTFNLIRELQIKTAMRHHYKPIRMVKIQNTDNTRWSQGYGAIGTLISLVGMQNVINTMEDSLPNLSFVLTLIIYSRKLWYLRKEVENLRLYKTYSFIYNYPNLEKNKTPFSRWLIRKWWHIKTMGY